MKSSSKRSLLTLFVLLLSAFVFAKLLWVIIAYLWLPKQGVGVQKEASVKPLYYRPKLTPNLASKPKPVAPKQPTVIVPKSKIADIKVTGIYAAGSDTVVAIRYKGKSKVLAVGEEVGGFVLKGATSEYAVFEKDGKRYEVKLSGIKSGVAGSISPAASASSSTVVKKEEHSYGSIRDAGDRKIIDRSLVQHYMHNFREIGKNIGIVEARDGNKLKGFKVTFIRNNSDFAKLGLRRGDIITAVNGQPVDSYRAAMQIYKNAASADALTMTVQRGNEEVELEYEVN